MKNRSTPDLGTPAVAGPASLTLTIDGKPVRVAPGTSVLRAAALAGSPGVKADAGPACTGRRSTKHAPGCPSGRAVHCTLPPWRWAMERTSASPRPTPPARSLAPGRR